MSSAAPVNSSEPCIMSWKWSSGTVLHFAMPCPSEYVAMQYSMPSERSRSRILSSSPASYCGVGTARIYSPGAVGRHNHG